MNLFCFIKELISVLSDAAKFAEITMKLAEKIKSKKDSSVSLPASDESESDDADASS